MNRFIPLHTAMWRNAWVALVLLATMSYAYSGFGANALGEEKWPVNTQKVSMGYSGMALVGEGFSLYNPAAMAYETKTFFTASGELVSTMAKEGNFKSNSTNSSVNYIDMNINLGFLGALGFAYWQRYQKDFAVDIDYSQNAKDQFLYDGSIFEIVPGYAYRLPGELRRWAVGVSFHIPFGHERHMFRFFPEAQGEQFGDIAVQNTVVTREVLIDSELDSEDGLKGYLGGSFQYHSALTDFYVSYTQDHALLREFTVQHVFDSKDTLVPVTERALQKFPITWGTGLALRPTDRITVSTDFFLRDWSAPEYHVQNRDGFNVPSQLATDLEYRAGVGMEYSGSGRFFDPFLKKLSYRIGFMHHNLYIGDVAENIFTLGSGIPLGRRGSKLDLALLGGWRSMQGTDWKEQVWGISFSVSGMGNWGQPSRRYR